MDHREPLHAALNPCLKNETWGNRHGERATEIVNQLGAEYGAWYGWRDGFGRYVALGEYILEETESTGHHDAWLVAAREAFLKWKKDNHIDTTPPANREAK